MNIQFSSGIHHDASQRVQHFGNAVHRTSLGSLSQPSDVMNIRFSGTDRVALQKEFIESVRTNGVLVSGGAGTMGNDIAMNAMNFGIPVYAQDMASKKDLIVAKMKDSYGKAISKGVMTDAQVEGTMANLRGTLGTISEEGDAYPENPAIVVEAIPEVLDWKTGLFSSLDQKLGPDTILATNTSSLSVDQIAAATNRPDKVIGLHYFLPANRNRFIEVIPGTNTSEETIQKTLAFVKAVGKTPIVCKDSPGFVVNRIGVPLINEGVRIFDEMKTGDAEHDKKLASYIDQVALETMWPTMSKQYFSMLKKNVLLPMGTLNRPEYMGLIGEIVEILDKGLSDKYGKSYAPTGTIEEKMGQFKEVSDAVRGQAREAGWSEEQIRDEVAKGLAQYATPIYEERLDIPAALYTKIQDRLLGAVMGVAGQLLDEGVTNAEDIDRGTKSGFRWEVGPMELMNKMGVQKANELIVAYSQVRPGFKPSETVRKQSTMGNFPLSYVDSRREGDVQYLTINKPQRNNAMDSALLRSIRTELRKAEADPSVNTIVIESIGGKNFAAGADLPWLMAEVEEYRNSTWIPDLKVGKMSLKDIAVYKQKIEPFLQQGFSLMHEIARSTKVTVAKVNGNALGGGTELALACDYIVAGESANMGLPEVKYGIFPAWGGTERMADRIGIPLAKWMIMEGGFMGKGGKGPAILNGTDAATIGLVDKVVPDIELDSAVKDAIDNGEFAEKPVREGRTAFNRDLCGTRFDDAHWRYAVAPLGELLDTNLSGYYDRISDEGIRGKMRAAYKRVLGLALRRIEKNLNVHPAKDLQQMIANMQMVDSLERKAKKAAKQS